MVTNVNCIYCKISKKGVKCSLIKTSPNCNDCEFFVDISDEEKIKKIEHDKMIINSYKKSNVKIGYEKYVEGAKK